MDMSVLHKKVDIKITIAILSLEVFAALLSLVLIVYPNINVKPIKAIIVTPPLLQINGLDNPGSIASNATSTFKWDYTKFFGGDKTKYLQLYNCYDSGLNNLNDTSSCTPNKNTDPTKIRWPKVLNTGTAIVAVNDSMIPTPSSGCDRSLQKFVIGIADPANPANFDTIKAISNKVSITGINSTTVCPAITPVATTTPTITSLVLSGTSVDPTYGVKWIDGEAKTLTITGTNFSSDYYATVYLVKPSTITNTSPTQMAWFWTDSSGQTNQ
ncbi:MAG: hypothetical protein NT094_00305, partial [Candidatus Staskawiczbacteria bacterium]|nr:hypothetical protein [Candidatus Staskawiczbacteria bacterium]